MRYGVRPRIRFGTVLTFAHWQDDHWRLETSRGPLEARVLVLATGPLSAPALPNLPGLDDFAGATMHSGYWDLDHDVTGERVAVIGTGASAIQFVPAIQPQVGQMHVFQRTPPWLIPHTDRGVTGMERRLFAAVPPAQRAVRRACTGLAGRTLGIMNLPVIRQIQRVAEWHLRVSARSRVARSCSPATDGLQAPFCCPTTRIRP